MQYQKQIYKTAHKDITLVCDARLNPSLTDAPLSFYDDMSRFTLTLINNDTKRTMQANLRVDEIRWIVEKSRMVQSIELYKQSCKKEKETTQNQTSPAYMVRIRMCSNKTPAEMLLSGEKNEDDLNVYKDILKENMSKFPQNAEAITAIDNALELKHKGLLKQQVSEPNGEEIEIYSSEYRYMTGHFRNDDKTTSKVKNYYTLKFSYCPGRNNPWKIELINDLHRIIKDSSGNEKEQPDSFIKLSKYSFFNNTEYWYLLERFERSMDWFEKVWANKLGGLYYQEYSK